MLVLSRKESQRIRLGEDIVITVVRLAGDKVRLGIDAPRDMLVLRDELEPLEEAAASPESGSKKTANTSLPQLGNCCSAACGLAVA
ncbi:MAG: carbon storage regulator [Lacipirellulaceae bacterium]